MGASGAGLLVGGEMVKQGVRVGLGLGVHLSGLGCVFFSEWPGFLTGIGLEWRRFQFLFG